MSKAGKPAERVQHYVNHLQPLRPCYHRVSVFVQEDRDEEKCSRGKSKQNAAYGILNQRVQTGGRDRCEKQ